MAKSRFRRAISAGALWPAAMEALKILSVSQQGLAPSSCRQGSLAGRDQTLNAGLARSSETSAEAGVPLMAIGATFRLSSRFRFSKLETETACAAST
ncbi:MAG: hypothetical protein ACK5MQ_15675 [Pikeienuella sp.]